MKQSRGLTMIAGFISGRCVASWRRGARRAVGRAGAGALAVLALALSPDVVLGHASEPVTPPRLTLPFTQSLAMVDLNGRGDPISNQGQLSNSVLSADGEHIAWVWDSEGSKNTGSYGFIWRDLQTGREISEPGLYPYGLDMSANGEYVAYSLAAEIEKDGYVKGMDVVLLNTTTGAKQIIDRLNGDKADDGNTLQLSVSANGDFVAFSSSSQALAPSGESVCTPLLGGCPDKSGYVYLYDRLAGTLTPVPPQPYFTANPALIDAVVSGDGSVVAFHDGYGTVVWYPADNVVRQIDSSAFACSSDGQHDLALSADGSTLVDDCAFGINVVHLGGPTGTDTLEWSYSFGGNKSAAEDTVAVDADGSEIAFVGPSGPAGWGTWPTYVTSLPSGTPQVLPAPGVGPSLAADHSLEGGMGDDQVSMDADGSKAVTIACAGEQAAPGFRKCPRRNDVFLWTLPG